jgi:endonuclease/exonuclease/phosphatase family metal-dependent hydrolase
MTCTFVAMTYNLWGDAHLAERDPALRALLRTRPPDLLATQELRGESRDLIDGELVGHDRVVDEHRGWERQSNLWWHRELFTRIEHGVRDVGILDAHAGLFWVRLRALTGAELVFATAHLTWPGHAEELATGVNLRTGQARAVTAALDELAGEGACLFTVDINDIGPPLWELGNAGFLDSFTALGAPSPPTHPVVPMPFSTGRGTRKSPVQSPAKAIDWLFHRGPLRARTSEVVEFFHDGSAPSDHRPVVATFTLPEGESS